MASAKSMVAVMGLGAVALVAAGLFFVLGDEPGPGGGSTGDDETAVAEKGARPEDAGQAASRGKKQKKGTAGIYGVLKTKRDEAPAEGRKVVLESKGTEPWTSTTDAKGEFRFAELPHGDVYELRIEAEGFATIRMPGLALDRDEQRDLGTLWLDAAISVTVEVRNYRDEPIAGADVSAYVNATGAYDWQQRLATVGVEPVALETTKTDAAGNAVFPELAPGTWTFTAMKEGFAKEGKTSPELSSKSDPKPIRIYLGTAFRVSGRVVDGAEAPIGGALVMASPPSNWWQPGAAPLSTRTTADENGNYTLDRLPAGNTQIWAARPGGVPSPVATLRVPPVDHYDLHLIAGGVLKGQVTMHDSSEPVPDALVRATGWSNGAQRIAEATTDAEGRYVIDTLLEGQIQSLTVQKKGFVQYTQPNEQWQQIPINRDDTIERDLKMQKAARLTGVVTGPDGPVAGANVNTYTMRQGGMGWDNKQTKTDAKGAYEIPGVMPGKTLIQVMKAGLYQKNFPQNTWMALQQSAAPPEYLVEMPEEGEATKDIALVVGATVEGRVETSDGSSPEGAKVNAVGATATVAADGTYHIDGVTPGPQVFVTVTREGYAAKAERIEVKPDEPKRDVNLKLVKMGTVFGTVTSSRGADLRDAYVQIQPAASGRNDNQWEYQNWAANWGSADKAPVKADGTYELRMPFAEGKFQVRAVSLDHDEALSDPVDVVAGQDRYQVDLALGEGLTLTGRVLLANTVQGVPDASVTLQENNNNRGRFYGGWGGQQPAIVAVTDAAGTFSVPYQSAGSYSVSAAVEGHIGASKSIKLPEGNAVDLFVDPALEITGFVLLPDGSPVEGVNVSAVSADKPEGNRRNRMNGMGGSWYPMMGGGGASATTGADGGYRLQKLKAGNYILNVAPNWNGKTNIRDTKSDPVAAGTTEFKVTVQPGLTIAGRVIDPDGKGVAGLQLMVQPDPAKQGMPGRNAFTQNDGSFEVVGLVEGTYKVTVQNNGWGAGQEYTGLERAGVAAGEKNLEMKLDRGLTIEGVILDQEGKPAANRQLYSQWVPDPNQKDRQNNSSQWRMSMTDADGHFVVKGLEAGKYRLSTQPMWGNDGNEGEVLTGADSIAAGSTQLQLRLTGSVSISGVVVDETGRPLAKANVWAAPKGGGNTQSARTDDNGEFAIKNLTPGQAYDVTANRNGLKQTTINDVVGGASGVRLVVEKGFEVTGKVTDASGNVMARTYVTLTHAEKNSNSGAYTDESGKFSIAGLEQADYKVQAYRMVTDDEGNQTWSPKDLGTITAPAKDVELRMPN